MANATYPSQDQGQPNPAAYANIVGAVISLAVLVGIVGWGAKTLIRDSSGVPVVAALDGPMRVAPADPGGIPASHQGLTVNQVAGSQPLADLSENLQLAPRPVNLLDEDVPMGAARPTMRVDDTGLNVEMASVTVEDIPVQGSQTVEDLAA
ncbi:MAG: SPOR domain-containing protein, partial [Planktomarina sp.]